MEFDKSEEVMEEGRYLDFARKCREDLREILRDPNYASSGSDRAAQRQLRSLADRTLEQMQPPDAPAAIGRIDLTDGEMFYIGKGPISDGPHNQLVIDWRSTIGDLFYKATAYDPNGLARKRTFQHKGSTLIDFDDIIFADLRARITDLESNGEPVKDSAPLLSDALFDELDRSRAGEMHDIVSTIQAAQSELIRSDISQLLVIQGGPGTGKTAVALHRVSWILYHYQLEEADLLVIGPNRTFLRYIEKVLPSLGSIRVPQTDVFSLGAFHSISEANEDADLLKLKGSAVMAKILKRAVDNRLRMPSKDLAWSVGRLRVKIDRDEVKTALDRFSSLPYVERRNLFRTWLSERAAEYARGDTSVSREQVARCVDRIIPNLNARQFLADLYGSHPRLLAAAADDLTAKQVESLYRQSAERVTDEPWTPADVPLLDYADRLISTHEVRRYRHIVVDEAQDLSPMQLKMISRRSIDGSMTVVGDIAQSTGPFARGAWTDVAEHLINKHPLAVGELRYGYRVPRQVFTLAEQLLPHIAPDITPPIVVRDGPEEPEQIHCSDKDLVERAIDAARKHAGSGRSVGLICPDLRRGKVKQELLRRGVQFSDAAAGKLGSSISLVSPVGAKGLEFDAVVIVDPASIVASENDGYRLLYVALTRTTKFLSIVHTGIPIPLPVTANSNFQTQHAQELQSESIANLRDSGLLTAEAIDGIANDLLEILTERAAPAMWTRIIGDLNSKVERWSSADAVIRTADERLDADS